MNLVLIVFLCSSVVSLYDNVQSWSWLCIHGACQVFHSSFDEAFVFWHVGHVAGGKPILGSSSSWKKWYLSWCIVPFSMFPCSLFNVHRSWHSFSCQFAVHWSCIDELVFWENLLVQSSCNAWWCLMCSHESCSNCFLLFANDNSLVLLFYEVFPWRSSLCLPFHASHCFSIF